LLILTEGVGENEWNLPLLKRPAQSVEYQVEYIFDLLEEEEYYD
jgi:hypothetical protein